MREIEAVMGAQALSALVLFDAIIANRNTHLGNFKMLVDNNLLLRSAPIFDNGRAFFNHIRGFSKGGLPSI
ncbi:hypothetical protein [Helicobacter felistomachi]|uniref:hypothetical protein n=1 Tax=Helicobacter felistomachi TaxID=3040201 RepID=UPI0025735A6A|nr:hypothetical protein [Helicobacter sp. NHP21005]